MELDKSPASIPFTSANDPSGGSLHVQSSILRVLTWVLQREFALTGSTLLNNVLEASWIAPHGAHSVNFGFETQKCSSCAWTTHVNVPLVVRS